MSLLWEDEDEDDVLLDDPDEPIDLVLAVNSEGVSLDTEPEAIIPNSEEVSEQGQQESSDEVMQECPESSVVEEQEQSKSSYETDSSWHSDDYVHDEQHSYESKQIDITKKSSSVEYPLLYLKLNNQSTIELNLLKSMLRTSCQDAEAMYFHIYLDVCGSIIKPQGVLRNVELKTLLSSRIFTEVEKYIKLDDNTVISGDMMFALCAADC